MAVKRQHSACLSRDALLCPMAAPTHSCVGVRGVRRNRYTMAGDGDAPESTGWPATKWLAGGGAVLRWYGGRGLI
eukprot:scaffold3856_cov276-Prasinococcus_capsulatus_cf.AAC.2